MANYDIGVMGFWYSCNYGSILTYFALNSCLKDMGKSVLMIDKPVIVKGDIEYKKTHSRIFAENEYNISKIYELYDLDDLNQLCDCFITGSDQLWNYYLARPFGFSLFLDFVKDDKLKIAYATSFGHENFDAPVGYKNIAKEYLDKFDRISVREKSGETILKKDFSIDGLTVADPIFLCRLDEYERVLLKSKIKPERDSYIVAYILDYSDDKKRFLEEVQKKFNKPVILIVDGLPWKFEENKSRWNNARVSVAENVTVCEFLYLIKNSFYVVTDSYHGTCVSLIFEKQFISIGNVKRGLTRFISLLSELNLVDRMVTTKSEFVKNLNKKIDYTDVRSAIKSFADNGRNWLSKAINIRKTRNENDNTVLKLDSEKCSGCGTCFAVCNRHAIEMVKDKNGFYHPVINNALCNDCGLCEKRCPVLHHKEENIAEPRCFAVMASDEIRRYSSSGGMFSLLANEVMSDGGYVCGAVYDDNYNIIHKCSYKETDINMMRGSKYYQSSAWACFEKVKEVIQKNKVDFIIEARDAGEDGKEKIAFLAKNIEKFNLFSIDELDRALNKENTVHIAVLKSDMSRNVYENLKKYQNFLYNGENNE